MDANAILDPARMALSGVVVAVGLLLMAGGALGLLRFPDVYTRLHAANVADAVGPVVVVLGLLIVAPDWILAFRLVLVVVLIGSIGPTLTHLIAQAAHTAGLAPLAGRLTATRPGSTSQ